MSIEEIKKRLEASPGPWIYVKNTDWGDTDCGRFEDSDGIKVMDFGDAEQYYPTQGDAPSGTDMIFIQNAHSDIAYLLEQNQRLVEALEQIASGGFDEGKGMSMIAYEALQAYKLLEKKD